MASDSDDILAASLLATLTALLWITFWLVDRFIDENVGISTVRTMIAAASTPAAGSAVSHTQRASLSTVAHINSATRSMKPLGVNTNSGVAGDASRFTSTNNTPAVARNRRVSGARVAERGRRRAGETAPSSRLSRRALWDWALLILVILFGLVMLVMAAQNEYPGESYFTSTLKLFAGIALEGLLAVLESMFSS